MHDSERFLVNWRNAARLQALGDAQGLQNLLRRDHGSVHREFEFDFDLISGEEETLEEWDDLHEAIADVVEKLLED